jgi:hypothetical protein
MSILGNDLLLGSGDEGYNLTRSLRFRASASANLNRTPATTTNRQTWTWSAWVKRGSLGSVQNLFAEHDGGTSDAGTFYMRFETADTLSINAYTFTFRTTTQVFRDPSAWYHIVLVLDTPQATALDRLKLYVNGFQVTAFSTTNNPTQNTNYGVNLAAPHYIGRSSLSAAQYFDGYLAEVNFIDGQALTPSSFGSTNATTGVWQPARYTGTYGTNGFYLPFTDNSALTTSSNVGLGKDFSGNGNYWTTNNISITSGVTYDSMTDVPTLTSATAANFAVLNPLNKGANITLSAANLEASYATTASTSGIATIACDNGKWYWEITLGTVLSGAYQSYVVLYNQATWRPISHAGSGYIAYRTSDGSYVSDSGGSGSFSAGATTGDVIGVAVDVTNGTFQIFKNGSSLGTITGLSINTNTWTAGYSFDNTISTSWKFNFGQRPFAYTPPTGFVALNTFNLPTSTIVKGNTVMDATTYTGTGASLSVTNAASFKPDLVWAKGRSGATDHALYDSVRGTTKQLESNTDSIETTEATGLTAFGSAGFTVGALAQMNTNTATYVGWQWQAGQGSTSSNTNGTITSTVSVNASAGFSIATYTGTGANATVGHGLGVAPSFIIVKVRDVAGYLWLTYHSSVGANSTTYLNSSSAPAASSSWWNNTSPTSSVFTVGTSNYSNQSSKLYVAYCWTPIAGYSAFGSYTGNGSADGPFVYTGFRPKFVLYKRTDSSGSWGILDSARNPNNPTGKYLYPNASDAEFNGDSSYPFDFLSNGFKIRHTGASENASGGTYIYMAFAENPFKNSLAR